ncbi:MAG TPA: zf-HC2 domain-containing protein [Bryobacteraceae bacterium]|nr:zf-HC2 domain-containing protein [Bryobacteraceae bacterium]
MPFLFAQGLVAGQHLEPEMLGLYVLGDLSVNTALAVEEHLAWCTRCNDELPNVKAVIAALRA